MDKILFRAAYLRNRKKNSDFRARNPHLAIPPDYFLYETHRLNYEQFISGGKEASEEIIRKTKDYLHGQPLNILDWGCGVSCIAPGIATLSGSAHVFACDINARMIHFNERNYKGVSYSTISYLPPTGYSNNFFDLIYSLSVFTHIEEPVQKEWIKEISRILKPGGIFFFSTHGKNFRSKLTKRELKELQLRGAYTKAFKRKGHRMMTTYNTAEAFRNCLHPFFEVLRFYDGHDHPEAAGGQDLWIVRKKVNSSL